MSTGPSYTCLWISSLWKGVLILSGTSTPRDWASGCHVRDWGEEQHINPRQGSQSAVPWVEHEGCKGMDGHSPCGILVGGIAGNTGAQWRDPASTDGIQSPRALLRSLRHASVLRNRFCSFTVLQNFLKVHWAKCMHFGSERRGQRTHCAGHWWLFAHGFFLPLTLLLYNFLHCLLLSAFFPSQESAHFSSLSSITKLCNTVIS